MHLEVDVRAIGCKGELVSILVSIWMHLEVFRRIVMVQLNYVSILVSIWMHLEVECDRIRAEDEIEFQS